jgi:hypothetical protein
MNQSTEVQKAIDEKSTKFGKQVSNLVSIAQPDPAQQIRCPSCYYDFLPGEADIEPMDLDKIAADIATSTKAHIHHIVNMAIVERSNGADHDNTRLIASLEKQRDTANQTAQTLADEIDTITPMISALTFIASNINEAKQRIATAMLNQTPAEEIALIQGRTFDAILEKIHSVSPKPTGP